MQRSEPKSPSQRAEKSPSWESRLWATGLVLLVAVVYLPTLNNGFVCDDDAAVENNFALRSARGLFNIWLKPDAHDRYEPLTLTTFWAEYCTSVGSHAVRLPHRELAAACRVGGAVLAAAHTARGSRHVARRGDLRRASGHGRDRCLGQRAAERAVLPLALGSLLAYLRFSPPELPKPSKARLPTPGDNRRYYALSLMLYVAALLSNAVTAVLPAVLVVIYAWKRGRVTSRDVVRLVPFLVVGLALACVMVSMPGSFVSAEAEGGNLGLLQRLSIAGLMWFYAGKLAWPHPLIFVYPRWTTDPRAGWQYLFPAAVLAVLVGLWWARPRIGPGPLVAVLIFTGTLAATMILFGVNPLHEPFVADRFQYHASITLIALAAATVALAGGQVASQTPWLARLAVVGILLPLAGVRTTGLASTATRQPCGRIPSRRTPTARLPNKTSAPCSSGPAKTRRSDSAFSPGHRASRATDPRKSPRDR